MRALYDGAVSAIDETSWTPIDYTMGGLAEVEVSDSVRAIVRRDVAREAQHATSFQLG